MKIRIIQSVQSRIYEIRGKRVMLDFDVADLYEIELKDLTQAVAQNAGRYTEEFAFRLEQAEYELIKQEVKAVQKSPSTQNAAGSLAGFNDELPPYAFSVEGLVMLSAVLNSPIANKMNMTVSRSFIETVSNKEKISRSGEDPQLRYILEAITNLLDKNASQAKWNERNLIGF